MPLEVPERVHQSSTPEIDLERGSVVGSGSRGMGLPSSVELPQLGQLLQKPINQARVVPLALLSHAMNAPFRGTSRPFEATAPSQ